MRLVDVNILVYAVNSSLSEHHVIKPWLERQLAADRPVGLCWTVLSGFLRVATRKHAAGDALSLDQALELVSAWLDHSGTRLVQPSEEHWFLFSDCLREAGRAGSITTDAHLAAIAIGNGAELASCDTDFARFSKLRWFNPLAA